MDLDPDVTENISLLDSGFMPVITDVHKYIVGKNKIPVNMNVHGYGGVRLWPKHGL